MTQTSFGYKTRDALSTISHDGEHLQKRSSLNNSIPQESDSVNRKFSADALVTASGRTKNTAEGGVKWAVRNNIVDENGRKYENVVELDYRGRKKLYGRWWRAYWL